MMFGFACTDSEAYETGSYMPAPIYFSHTILKILSDQRRSGKLGDLLPDAKSQVTIKYESGKAIGAAKVVVSTQHQKSNGKGTDYTPEMIKEMIGDAVTSALPTGWMPKSGADFLVNPTGNFVVGGPDGDCGLTGRKIIVDTYGGAAPHGGGAFSGKDPSKVDRSAAYAGRYVAKNIVAAGLARECLIQVSYAIGIARPTSIMVDTFGTGVIADDRLAEIVQLAFDLRPKAIIQTLDLLRPIYEKTAAYGHFGRDEPEFSWESTDKVEALRAAAGIGTLSQRA
jgi:S-adenosylmethionine synthetase